MQNRQSFSKLPRSGSSTFPLFLLKPWTGLTDRHNLGLTCDPIGGLVQIPCIERNSLGGTPFPSFQDITVADGVAVKAVTAAQLAMAAGGEHTVSYVSFLLLPLSWSRWKQLMNRLDDAIEACRTTALDMHSHCTSCSLLSSTPPSLTLILLLFQMIGRT